jgi:hypothetical protein
MNLWPAPPPDNKVAGASQFQSGDKVRSLHGSVVMNVVAVLGDDVHCEYLIGTEPHRRTIDANSLVLVFRDLNSRTPPAETP